MNDLYLILLQKGLLHKGFQPCGWRGDTEILNSCKGIFLAFVVFFRGIQHFALGIFVLLRTILTLRFPLFTPTGAEICAMPRHRPAVMERPYHRDILLLDIPEQKLNMDIIPMQVVQVNDIRRI